MASFALVADVEGWIQDLERKADHSEMPCFRMHSQNNLFTLWLFRSTKRGRGSTDLMIPLGSAPDVFRYNDIS